MKVFPQQETELKGGGGSLVPINDTLHHLCDKTKGPRFNFLVNSGKLGAVYDTGLLLTIVKVKDALSACVPGSHSSPSSTKQLLTDKNTMFFPFCCNPDSKY